MDLGISIRLVSSSFLRLEPLEMIELPSGRQYYVPPGRQFFFQDLNRKCVTFHTTFLNPFYFLLLRAVIRYLQMVIIFGVQILQMYFRYFILSLHFLILRFRIFISLHFAFSLSFCFFVRFKVFGFLYFTFYFIFVDSYFGKINYFGLESTLDPHLQD